MDAYKVILPKALDAGLSPVQAKEMVYQSFDYLGMGRVWPFLEITNKILEERGGAGRCPCPLRLRPPWKTAWKRVRRPKRKSLGNI